MPPRRFGSARSRTDQTFGRRPGHVGGAPGRLFGVKTTPSSEGRRPKLACSPQEHSLGSFAGGSFSQCQIFIPKVNGVLVQELRRLGLRDLSIRGIPRILRFGYLGWRRMTLLCTSTENRL